jgi:predicted DNA-binding protein
MAHFKFPEVLIEALNEFGQATGRSNSDIVRAAVAKYIGRPDLSDIVRIGRPAARKHSKRPKFLSGEEHARGC